MFYLLMLVFNFILICQPQLAIGDQSDIEQLNTIENKLNTLKENEKSLKELIEFTGSSTEKKDDLGSVDTEKLKQVQTEITTLNQQRSQLINKINQPVWVLINSSLNPDNVPENDGTSENDVHSFKVLAKNKCQLHVKKVIIEKDKPKVLYDRTFTFTYSEMPAIIDPTQPFVITVNGLAEGQWGKDIWAKANVTGSTTLGFRYQGQGDDKNCWVGNLKDKAKDRNQGIYHITLPPEGYNDFTIKLGLTEIGSPVASTFVYELKKLNQ